MIELQATIETGYHLQCWTRAIQMLSKLNESMTFEIKPNGITLSGFNSSRCVFESAYFPSPYFRDYKYGLFKPKPKPKSKSKSKINKKDEEEEEEEEVEVEDPGTTTFELQTRYLAPIYRRVEKDHQKIHQLRLRLIDQLDEAEQLPSNKTRDRLGLASCLEMEVVGSNKILKTYRISCMNTHQQVYTAQVSSNDCPCNFAIESRAMKRYMDHMAQRTEEFAFTFEPGAISFKSRTPQVISDGGEVLKRPIDTEVVASLSDLDYAHAIVGQNMSFRIKEFRNLVLMGDSLVGSVVQARYKEPEFPICFDVVGGPGVPNGVRLSAVFMTNGETAQVDENSEQQWIHCDNAETRIGRQPNYPTQQHQQQPTQYATQSQEYEPVHPEDHLEDDPEEQDLFCRSQDEPEEHEQPIDWGIDEMTSRPVGDAEENDDVEFEDLDEQELDRELEELRSQSVMGPTQNQSQAKGLFD